MKEQTERNYHFKKGLGKTTRISLLLFDEQLENLMRYAKANKLNKNEIIRDAIQVYLKKMNKTKNG